MARIDFPKNATVHTDLNGVVWKKVNNSWVKQFDWSEESPGTPNIEYCKKNQEWSPIVYPIPDDVPITGIYGRVNGGWSIIAKQMGPDTAALDPKKMYAVKDSKWVLIPNEDLTDNYYDKSTSDGRFSNVSHTHDVSTVTGLGALAVEADAGTGTDDIQYIRKNFAWEEVVIPVTPKLHNSATIIDPIGSDDAILFWTSKSIIVEQVRTATLTTGSVTFNVYYSKTADGSDGLVNQVFDVDQTSSAPAGTPHTPSTRIIPAESYVWLGIIGEPSSSPSMFHITTVHTEV